MPVAQPIDAMSRGGCGLTSWLVATSNNTSPRRVIVVDAWPHTGIGHSIRAAALWLQLLRHHDRSVRLAFSCVPARLQSHFQQVEHEVPACSRKVFDPISRANVTAVPFDPLQHLSFHGLTNLGARRSDFSGVHHGSPPVQSCLDMRERLQSTRKIVVLYGGARLRKILQTCVEQVVPRRSVHACLRAVHLVSPWPLPACDVGLHLRSMRLDDSKCDLLSMTRSVGTDCAFTWRRRRCPAESLLQVASCPTTLRRFATADSPHLYSTTREIGWHDLGETASVTWNERALTPYPVQLADVRATAAAFVALARCRRAIVAPVVSHFSETAALAAGVPIFGCCTEMMAQLSQRIRQVAKDS